jgi:hypothetical protein
MDKGDILSLVTPRPLLPQSAPQGRHGGDHLGTTRASPSRLPSGRRRCPPVCGSGGPQRPKMWCPPQPLPPLHPHLSPTPPHPYTFLVVFWRAPRPAGRIRAPQGRIWPSPPRICAGARWAPRGQCGGCLMLFFSSATPGRPRPGRRRSAVNLVGLWHGTGGLVAWLPASQQPAAGCPSEACGAGSGRPRLAR